MPYSENRCDKRALGITVWLGDRFMLFAESVAASCACVLAGDIAFEAQAASKTYYWLLLYRPRVFSRDNRTLGDPQLVGSWFACLEPVQFLVGNAGF
jgi:hypothetical protein